LPFPSAKMGGNCDIG